MQSMTVNHLGESCTILTYEAASSWTPTVIGCIMASVILYLGPWIPLALCWKMTYNESLYSFVDSCLRGGCLVSQIYYCFVKSFIFLFTLQPWDCSLSWKRENSWLLSIQKPYNFFFLQVIMCQTITLLCYSGHYMVEKINLDSFTLDGKPVFKFDQ